VQNPDNAKKIEVVLMTDSLVVKAKIKDVAKGYNVAGDLADALSQKVEQLIKEACKRADANGRKTVMAKDI
jgi:histone H3/H4